MSSIICDSEFCEYNEDGYCEKEKVEIVNMFCESNRCSAIHERSE